MTCSIRARIEARERATLSRFAKLAAESAGREVPEPPDPMRTCFMRDRDRILHSKPFRRLKHKTQVFLSPTGDHYRTRLTHTLEVAQIARTIARALSLNEDLTEAIALGHDVGHTPFGHAGEWALDQAVKRHIEANPNAAEALAAPSPGFRHYEQSLRVLQVLEGLNLTVEVREGIAGHSKGRASLQEDEWGGLATLEASVVRISDRIAYLNHDLDDALRAGVIARPPDEALVFGETHSQRISAMVTDVVERSFDQPTISMSMETLRRVNALKDWMFENVYERTRGDEIALAKRIVSELFEHYVRGGALPPGYHGLQGAIDYVAGMTDRFALDAHSRLGTLGDC